MRLLKAASLVFMGILIGSLGACEAARAGIFPSLREKANKITYTKDDRTTLCYAHNVVQDDHGLNWDVFTNVPCSQEVERLIK